jgi:hypothetical protein
MIRLLLTPILILLFYDIGAGQSYRAQTDPARTPFLIDIEGNINNKKNIKLSSLGKELQYIPLETRPECLINEIYKVEINESYIFVSAFTKLLQFDNNGVFIRQIGSQGRGPAEYLSVKDFCIDNEKKEVLIISTGRLMTFSFEGKFKRSDNISFRPAQVILKDPNSIMYHLFNITTVAKDIDPDSWVLTDRQGKILYKIPNSLKRVSKLGIIVGDTPFYHFNNSIHFMEFGVDTLYYFVENQKKPYAIVKLGKYKMDPDPTIPLAYDAREKLDKELSTRLSINNIIEDNKYLYIELRWGISDSFLHAIYDKSTSETKVLSESFFSNDINGGQGFWPKQVINDHILINHIDAFDLLKTPLPSKLKGKINESSNPVLIVLK